MTYDAAYHTYDVHSPILVWGKKDEDGETFGGDEYWDNYILFGADRWETRIFGFTGEDMGDFPGTNWVFI